MAKATKTESKNKGTDIKKSTANSDTEPGLMKLFVDEIKDIYWAEKHLVKTLPKMKKAATSSILADAIGNHLQETKQHVSRLETIFGLLDKKIQAKKCDAMEGLAKEGEGIIEDTKNGSATRDAGIILASQKVEHYEIATYGGLVQLATTLGLEEIAGLLSQTLEEEKQADETLSGIAKNDINYKASKE
jgi:ferritin-like metal-binding protein YciE